MGYWYLFFLWQCYLITHLYNIVCAGKLKSLGKRRFAVDAIFVLVMIAGIKAVWKLSLMDNDTWGLYWLFGLYPLFFAGHVIQREGVIGKMFEWRGRWFDIAVIAYGGISLLAVVCFEARKGKGLVLQAAEPFAVYAIVCLFVKTRGYAGKWKTWLESCGRRSLNIYVLHYFLIQSCHMDFVAGPGSPFAGNYFVLTLLALFITAIIVLVCMAMSWLIRQSRLFGFLFLGIRENGNIEKFKN